MDVHLLDGTYELFRHYFGMPADSSGARPPLGGVGGVLGTVLRMFEEGVTHLGVATDHEIQSFRNELWAGYKTGADVDPVLLAQFLPLEEALEAMGVRVWPMAYLEADDALASAAARAAADPRVGRVFICTPDKDLGQSVVGERVVQLDRRQNILTDARGVEAKFGVPPAAIPDYLALVGDSADGFPGLAGWGAKSAAAVLGRYGTLEAIPHDHEAWDVPVRSAARLAAVLREHWDDALLFRDLATLRTTEPVFADLEELRWRGPTPAFEAWTIALEAPQLLERAERLARAAQGVED